MRSFEIDLGIQIHVKIPSDSSMTDSLTDRLGARPRTKHIDTLNFGIHELVQDGDLSIKMVPTAKTFADVGTKPVSASVLQLREMQIQCIRRSAVNLAGFLDPVPKDRTVKEKKVGR